MNGTYQELEARWKALRAAAGLRVREVACVNAPRTLLCAETGDASLPTVALAAGVHGDEPAGPWALLALLEGAELPGRFSYRIWPCINPSGFQAGTRANAEGADVNRTFGRGGQSPEARAVLTSNRDRKFALSIDLHEDCDASGFYCYEYGGGDLGRAAVAAVESAGFPIDALGRMTPDPSEEAALLGGLSYSLLLARHAARHALTFESPSPARWEDRIAMHRAAVLAALAAI